MSFTGHVTTASSAAVLTALLLVAAPVDRTQVPVLPGPPVPTATSVASRPECVAPTAHPRPERGPVHSGGHKRAY
ncbi:MAG: hypothetical protein ABWY33_03120 [Cellulomonas sp.]